MTNNCSDCNRCRAACPTGKYPGENNCTNCGDCHDICPAGAITFGRKNKPE